MRLQRFREAASFLRHEMSGPVSCETTMSFEFMLTLTNVRSLAQDDIKDRMAPDGQPIKVCKCERQGKVYRALLNSMFRKA